MEGEGIYIGNKIISKLPASISGSLITNFKGKKDNFGHVTILIDVQCYSQEKYKQFFSEANNFAQKIKERHFRLIMELATHVKGFGKGVIYKDAIRGSLGDADPVILFKKLGMGNLNTPQEQYALAVVISEILNTELRQADDLYFVEHYVSSLGGFSYSSGREARSFEYVALIKPKKSEIKQELIEW